MAATSSLTASVVFLLLAGRIDAYAQTDSLPGPVNKTRLIVAASSVGVAYTTSMIVLGNAWYQNDDRQSFHFFNDAGEWKQMDKAGHFYSAFHLNYFGSQILKTCNASSRTSDRIGALTGFLILSSIEVFDGYSAAYGASLSDMVANAAGTLFYLGQQAAWNETRIYPKFSFHHTSYSKLRPDVLGHGAEQLLKDYNGQTYWLSVDMDKMIRFPKWLNLSCGYGAEAMVYARDNQNQLNGYSPYRTIYLSVDFDLTAIPTKSKFLKTVLQLANMIRVPAPAIAFSSNGVNFHAFYH